MSGVTGSTPEHPERGIVERIDEALEGTTPARCQATLGTRPKWMGVDQWDPCSCRGENGHDGDHFCEHGTEPNRSPGVPTVVKRYDIPPDVKVTLADARSEITTRDAEIERLSAEVGAARDRASAMRERWSETWASPSDCAEVYPFPWESADASVPADPSPTRMLPPPGAVIGTCFVDGGACIMQPGGVHSQCNEAERDCYRPAERRPVPADQGPTYVGSGYWAHTETAAPAETTPEDER